MKEDIFTIFFGNEAIAFIGISRDWNGSSFLSFIGPLTVLIIISSHSLRNKEKEIETVRG